MNNMLDCMDSMVVGISLLNQMWCQGTIPESIKVVDNPTDTFYALARLANGKELQVPKSVYYTILYFVSSVMMAEVENSDEFAGMWGAILGEDAIKEVYLKMLGI